MRVRLTRPANDELIDILDYLAERSPQAADGFSRRFDRLLVQLASGPFTGVESGFEGIRRLPTNPYPYLVFYRVRADLVEIVAIRHGARDPASMPGAKGAP